MLDTLLKSWYLFNVEGNGRIAQVGERRPYKPKVAGSSPVPPTIEINLGP